MKNLLRALFFMLSVATYALEPLPAPPPLAIKPGNYLLVTQGQINDQAFALAQNESIIVELSSEGKLTIKDASGSPSIIETDGKTFSLNRKQKGREGIWITTYIGSLSSNEPVVYHGNYVSICKTDDYVGFDRGSFMLIYQKNTEVKK